MKNMPANHPLFNINFLFVCTINLFIFFNYQMIFPILPLYLRSFSHSNLIIGLIIGCLTLTSLMTRPFAGLALDKLGRKKVFLLGLSILFVSSFSYSLAGSLLAIVIIRLISGFGWGISGTAASTVAAELIPREHLGVGMGYMAMANSVSMAFAPAVALYVAHHYGFHHAFLLSSLPIFVGLLLAARIHYRSYTPPPSDLKKSLYEKRVFVPAFLIFFTSLTFGGIVSFLPLFAVDSGVDNIGLFFTAYAISIFFSRFFSGKLIDKFGYEYTIVPGFILIIIAMGQISEAVDLDDFLAAAVVYGLGFGSCQMSFQTMTVKNVEQSRLGAANATLYTGVDLGIGTGAVLLGFLSDYYGYANMYLICAELMAAILIIYLLFLRGYAEKVADKQI